MLTYGIETWAEKAENLQSLERAEPRESRVYDGEVDVWSVAEG